MGLFHAAGLAFGRNYCRQNVEHDRFPGSRDIQSIVEILNRIHSSVLVSLQYSRLLDLFQSPAGASENCPRRVVALAFRRSRVRGVTRRRMLRRHSLRKYYCSSSSPAARHCPLDLSGEPKQRGPRCIIRAITLLMLLLLAVAVAVAVAVQQSRLPAAASGPPGSLEQQLLQQRCCCCDCDCFCWKQCC